MVGANVVSLSLLEAVGTGISGETVNSLGVVGLSVVQISSALPESGVAGRTSSSVTIGLVKISTGKVVGIVVGTLVGSSVGG